MRIGMVSTYPDFLELHQNMGGVASYTKNLIKGMNEHQKNSFLIFANRIDSDEPKLDEKNFEIIRCWEGGSKAAFQIFFETIKNRKKIDVMHFQYEFFLYGGFLFSLVYPLMLILYSLFKIPVITTIHQVPPIRNIGKEFLETNEIRGNQIIFKIALFSLLFLIVRFSKIVIVHEIYFKDVLISQYHCNPNNVEVIPHGIEADVDIVEKNEAKKRLNLYNKKILLFFGYLSGYKGLDLLVDSFPASDDSYYLIIAGGKHPRLKTNSSYLQYLEKLRNKAKNKSNNIKFTGFLNEKDIPYYFSASDLVIFPYLSHFSSSGPLSLTLAYEKPFIVSKVFKKQIDEKSLIFELDAKDLHSKIIQFFESEELFQNAIMYSKKLHHECLWTNIGKLTIQLYNGVIG